MYQRCQFSFLHQQFTLRFFCCTTGKPTKSDPPRPPASKIKQPPRRTDSRFGWHKKRFGAKNAEKRMANLGKELIRRYVRQTNLRSERCHHTRTQVPKLFIEEKRKKMGHLLDFLIHKIIIFARAPKAAERIVLRKEKGIEKRQRERRISSVSLTVRSLRDRLENDSTKFSNSFKINEPNCFQRWYTNIECWLIQY